MTTVAAPLDEGTNLDPARWVTLAIVLLSAFIVVLDNTVLNVAIPTILREFHTTLPSLEWVITGYALTFATFLIIGGRLGDVFGRKRMFLGGLIVFTLGSVGAGLSGSINELVAFRGVQGAGAAFLMPGTLSILTHTFSGKDLGRALGLWAGISGLALGMGPVVGGLLVEKAGWEWIFFLNVPVALVAVPLTLWAVRESRDETAIKRVDVPGILSLSIGLGGLVLGLVQANDYGWTSGRILTEFAVGVVSLAAFILLQLRGRDPMLNMDFFRNRTFNAGNVVAFRSRSRCSRRSSSSRSTCRTSRDSRRFRRACASCP